ncbi:MAG: DUF192 domain-containing protein [Acidobacteriota bacterium]|nr:DUF192 domain-containing protein [Acidobacteriota bacterium]
MRYALICLLILLCGCGGHAALDDYRTSDVILPSGQIVKVETMMDAQDLMRGMMFRTSLAPDRGMLFVHRRPGNFTYWMYQTLIPLDIIWMDRTKQIVEIVESAPPCKTDASKCPHYGGHQTAQYVLELSGGMSRKYNLKVGDQLTF